MACWSFELLVFKFKLSLPHFDIAREQIKRLRRTIPEHVFFLVFNLSASKCVLETENHLQDGNPIKATKREC